MANRTLIKYEEYYLFRDFLLSTGKFALEEPKGKWEALRARYIGKPNKHIVYKSQKEPLMLFYRDRGCGFTIQTCYQFSGLFDQYREYKKKLGYESWWFDLDLQKQVLDMLKNRRIKNV